MQLWINSRGQIIETPVSEGPVVLGRDPDCDVMLVDPDVSGRHCRIGRLDDQTLQIEDLGSSNGTRVNGVRTDQARLSLGDSVQLGGTLILVVQAPEAGDPARSGRFARLDRESLKNFKAGTRRYNPSKRVKTGPDRADARGTLGFRVQQLTLLSQRIASELDLRRLLDTTLTAIVEFTGAARGAVFLRSVEGENHFAHGLNMTRELIEGDARRFIDAFLADALNTRDLVLGKRPNTELEISAATATVALCHGLCVPLLTPSHHAPRRGERRSRPPETENRIYGFLYLDRDEGAISLDSDDRQLIKSLATHAALCLQNVHLFRRATTDPLTGLLNRESFKRLLGDEQRAAKAEDEPLALIMLDLDHFKSINDRHGHPVGDAVLVEVADRLKSRLRGDDLVGRYGGEEFVIGLPRSGLEAARSVAESLRRVLAESPITEAALNVTASLGLAVFPSHAGDTDRLVKRADQALYAAKNSGRNRVVTWNSELELLGHQNDPLAGLISGDTLRDHRNLALFFRIAKAITTAPPTPASLSEICAELVAALRARHGVLLRMDNEALRLVAESPPGFDEADANLARLAERLDRQTTPTLLTPAESGAGCHALPLICHGELMGALLLEAEGAGDFRGADLGLFEALSGQLGLGLKLCQS